MSARSSSTSTRPDQSRTVVTGGVSTVDAESMKYSLVVRHGDDVVQLVVGDLGEAGAVQTDPAHRAPVRILVDQPGGGEVHHPLGLVDVQDLPHRPLPGGDLPEQRAGAQVVPYRWPQPSRWEYHSSSSASTRTIGGSVIHWLGSMRVAPVSLSTVVTSPVAGSSRCRVSVRRSRGWLR
jgi:hypothetical protein